MTPLGLVGVVLLLVVPTIPPFNQDYLVRWFILAAIMGTAAMAFDFSSGYISVVNFGYAAFMGLGAYGSALAALHWGTAAAAVHAFRSPAGRDTGFFYGSAEPQNAGGCSPSA